MSYIFLVSKRDEIRFAVITTIISFILGIIGYTIPIASEHIYFFISAPIATFLPSYLIWKLTFKKIDFYKISNVMVISLFLSIITHYLNYVVLGLGRLIWFHLINSPVNIGEVEPLLPTLTSYSFLRTLISLYHWGIISFILFTVAGIYVLKTTSHRRKKKNHQFKP